MRVQLRTDSDLLLTIVAETLRLVPGSLVIDLDREERPIAVHLLHVRDLADVESARRRAGRPRTASSGRSGRPTRSPRSRTAARRGREGGRRDRRLRGRPTRLLGGGALLALVRLARGPSLLDRVVATDTLLVIISAGLAVHAALERDPTVVPVLVVVSLLAFVGSVSIARYVGGMLAAVVRGRAGRRPPEAAEDRESRR